MKLLLNILWFVLGGWLSGTLWLLGGVLLTCTIVGLPWAGAAWRIAGFAYWPFGKEIVDRADFRPDMGTGCLGLLLNVIWIVFAGWYIALSHLMAALVEAVTIIGIPFALKDLQLAWLALAPVGKSVVPTGYPYRGPPPRLKRRHAPELRRARRPLIRRAPPPPHPRRDGRPGAGRLRHPARGRAR